jgi:hypothetical protein
MVKFKFKRINQEALYHYRPSAPTADGSAGGTVRPGSSADGTVRPDQTRPDGSAAVRSRCHAFQDER